MEHGTITAYTTAKCRCAECRLKWAEYQREWKHKNLIKTGSWDKAYRQRMAASKDASGKALLLKSHGNTAGYVCGCRCPECVESNRGTRRKYYHTPSGKAAYARVRKKIGNERKAFVDSLKSSPCMDCGYLGPPEAMDFDHRVGEKKYRPVSLLVRHSTSKKRLLDEIAKCDLVCANCHRIRTAMRRREKSSLNKLVEVA